MGIFISKIKLINYKNKISEKDNFNDNDKENNTHNKAFFYLEIIYLFNPLSIMCCVNLQLRTFYNFLLFFCLEKLTNIEVVNFLKLFFINIICIFTLLISPANFFILVFFYIKNLEGVNIKRKFYILSNVLISLLSFCVFIFGFLLSNKTQKEPIGSFYLYYNYFFMKDTFPNYGILWNLIPEVNIIIINMIKI